MELESYCYIVIDGLIGVGKILLVMCLLVFWGVQVVLEQLEGNFFLVEFYWDVVWYVFQIQVFFFLQCMGQLQVLLDLVQLEGCFIVDFILEKNILFVQLILVGDELVFYDVLYCQLQFKVWVLDLVIYLQVLVDVLQICIVVCGIVMEEVIFLDYL